MQVGPLSNQNTGFAVKQCTEQGTESENCSPNVGSIREWGPDCACAFCAGVARGDGGSVGPPGGLRGRADRDDAGRRLLQPADPGRTPPPRLQLQFRVRGLFLHSLLGRIQRKLCLRKCWSLHPAKRRALHKF